MANTKVIDRSGKGSALTATEYDSNVSSMSGVNEPQTGTTHTIDVNDQNKTLEYTNASAIAVTLPSIASVTGANLHTDDFKVTIKNIGAGLITITRGSTDTFDDGSTTKKISTGQYITIQTDNGLTKWNVIEQSLDGKEALTSSGTMAYDFNGCPLQTFTAGHNLATLTTSNRVAGKVINLLITDDGSARTITYNASWVQIGALPTTITTSKTLLLSLICNGSAETDVYVAGNIEL